jgi:hypothetical protein
LAAKSVHDDLSCEENKGCEVGVIHRVRGAKSSERGPKATVECQTQRRALPHEPLRPNMRLK